MLDVFFTFDVEVWCDGWVDIDAKFARSFRQYIYGSTAHGEFGLPYILAKLNEYNLRGVFFVEPLFATRFGLEPLTEIVQLIKESGHEIQLHLHTEWVDESREPLLENMNEKRQYLRNFSLSEQTVLIAKGIELIQKTNGGTVNAFRAGSFGFNVETMNALAKNNIVFDSSYNASISGLESGLMPGQPLTEPIECGSVYEYPMTVFSDGTRSLRHAQLTACSFREMEGLLWQACKLGRKAFVILAHNFELLSPDKSRPAEIVVNRFHRLCNFLDQNRAHFRVRCFSELEPSSVLLQPEPLASPFWRTGLRMMEQFSSRSHA